MNKNATTLSLSLVLFSSFAVMAHDTTHIHPLITARVADLIASSDVDHKKYEELNNWGQSRIALI